MTTFAYPDIRPQNQRWSLQNFTAIHKSPLNASISTMDRDGESWKVSMSYSDLEDVRRAQLMAFLFKLNGSQHRFTMKDFSYLRQGAGGGTPIVNGAAQTGKNLIISGGPTSQVNWLMVGDQIGIAGLLHSVDANVTTDGAGAATIIVSPRIFIAPANSAAVEIDTPTNSFALDVESIEVVTRPPALSSLSFSAVSAL